MMYEGYEEEKYEFEVIAGDPDHAVHQLPDEIKKYHKKYPCTVRQIGSVWGKPVFPKGYAPKYLDIYYGDHSPRGAAIYIRNGRITDVDLEANMKSPVVKALVDEQVAYVEIAGRVLLNRLNGIELPTAATNPVELLQIVTRQRRETGEE